jgi:putative ABC transport system substrate-binding protein
VGDRKNERKVKMKKLLALLLALAMVLSLAACGAKTETTTTEASDTAEETAEVAETEEVADAAEEEDDTVYTIGIIQLIEHAALDAATQGFKDALVDLLGEDHVVFDEQNAQGDSANCATIANSLVSEGVDLILANATASLQAAAAATADIPILGTSITDYGTALDMSDGWDGTTGRNISGTADLAPLDGQAEVLNELFPVEEYANVGIVYCSAEANSVYQATVIRGYLEDMGYTVTEYTFADSNDIASVVTNACDASDVLYIPTDNTAANCTETIDSVALPAGVPIIAGEEGICSGCGVATLSISYYEIGYIAGQMAYEVLVNGADISTMEVQYAPNFTKEYDAARCETLGITIPEDYVAIEVDE